MKLFNFFKNKKIKGNKTNFLLLNDNDYKKIYLNKIKNWKLGDNIYINYNNISRIGNLYAFDDDGNISILINEYKQEYINVNLIFNDVYIENDSLKWRNEKMEIEKNKIIADKIKENGRYLEIYQKELNNLELNDIKC